jgi:hypothetical protein
MVLNVMLYYGLHIIISDFDILSIQVPDFQKGYGDFINRLLTFSFVPLNIIGKKMLQ